jgi:hypothetical protein
MTGARKFVPATGQASDLVKDPESNIDLLLLLARERWRLLAILALTGALVLVAVSYLIRPVYRAEAILFPVSEEDPLSGAARAMADLGGLASLVGLTPQKSATAEAIETLKSSGFVRNFLTRNGLVGEMQTSNLLIPPLSAPDNEDDARETAVQRFSREVLQVSEDKRTGAIRLQIYWFDPQRAADWANELTSGVNEILRKKALAESERRLSYLREQALATNIQAIKEAIYRVVESEIKNATLANARTEFAFKVVDSAFPARPRDRVAPDRLAFAVFGMASGLLAGLAWIRIRCWPHSDRQ